MNDPPKALFVTVIGGIIASVLAAILIQSSNEVPTLNVAGRTEPYQNRTLIPLRTNTTVPVMIHGYRIRLRGYPVGSPIAEEGQLSINAATMQPNRWYSFRRPKFQMTRERISYLPVSVFHPTAQGWIRADIDIKYGRARQPSILPLRDVPIYLVNQRIASTRVRSVGS